MGVDVGARAEIYAHLRRLADDGLGVIFTSSDLPEVIGLSDTIATFFRGRLIRKARRRHDERGGGASRRHPPGRDGATRLRVTDAPPATDLHPSGDDSGSRSRNRLLLPERRQFVPPASSRSRYSCC